MRKIFSAILLTIGIFNLIGTRLISNLLEIHANNQIARSLDERLFDENQLMSIKLPVSDLAYYQYSRQFERVDGQLIANGIAYHFVERRIFNDSLELRCIPDLQLTGLGHPKEHFYKFMNIWLRQDQNKKAGSHNSKQKVFPTDSCIGNEGHAEFIASSLTVILPERSRFNLGWPLLSIIENPPEIQIV